MKRFKFPTRSRSVSVIIFLSFLGFLFCMQFTVFIWLSSKGHQDNFVTRFKTRDCSYDSSNPTGIKKETTVVVENEALKTKKKKDLITAKTRTPKPATVTTASTLNTSVDMDNDYYPLMNFTFVWPETTPNLKGKRDFFLVIMINSAAHGDKYRARRNAIRQTWANISACECLKAQRNPKLKNHEWILIFSLGKSSKISEDFVNGEEARINNDVLIGDFRDHYLNNVIKVYMAELWVSTLNVRYILKADDDVYVRVPSVIDWLITQNYPRQFYGGAPYFHFIVDRNPKGKWAVSRKYFAEDYFPTFCAGAFYVLSTDILTKLFNYVRRRRPFHTDDAYVGIAARDLNITVHRIPGLLLEDNMHLTLNSFSDCRLLQAKGYGHSIEPPLMNKVFTRLDDLCRKNRIC